MPLLRFDILEGRTDDEIGRSGKPKETFYRLLAENLHKACGIAPEE
jgi:hypothetical protein